MMDLTRQNKLLMACFKGIVGTCEIYLAMFKGRAKGRGQSGSGRDKYRKMERRGHKRVWLCVRMLVWLSPVSDCYSLSHLFTKLSSYLVLM